MVAPLVAALLCYRNPMTIIRTVTLVVVDAVNGQIVPIPMGHRPPLECSKIGKPFGAYGDPPAAIIFVIAFCGVVAPAFHVVPNAVKSCFSAAVDGIYVFSEASAAL